MRHFVPSNTLNQIATLLATTWAACTFSPVIAQLSGTPFAIANPIQAQAAQAAPRNNRHALIIGISRYEDPAIAPLPGVKYDKVSATQMARSMQIPTQNIEYLHDERATADNIRDALRRLNDRVQEGDRVFIHFSGHGSRYFDAEAGGCVESLLAYNKGFEGKITNTEMSSLLSPITVKSDKLFVMYDACHSGGLVNTSGQKRTRGMDGGLKLRPKAAIISDQCSVPSNVKTRNLVVEQTNKGALPQDIIHLSASRDNEVSFDDENRGGLATSAVRDCFMAGENIDMDRSGAVSIDEIRTCAQNKLEQIISGQTDITPQHLTLAGNKNFVPTWFAQGNVSRPSSSRPTTVASANVRPSVVTPPPTPSFSFSFCSGCKHCTCKRCCFSTHNNPHPYLSSFQPITHCSHYNTCTCTCTHTLINC